MGNKPPMRVTLSNEIDSFDYVIRINKMNYLGHSGNRIEGLYLEANNNFKYECNGGDNKKSLKSAQKILMRPFWYEKFDSWNDFITQEQYLGIELIDEKKTIESTGFDRLTSSILLIGHLLESHWFEEYNIFITCLDVENRALLIDNHPIWNWHKGGGIFEQRFLIEKLRSKLIYRISDE